MVQPYFGAKEMRCFFTEQDRLLTAGAYYFGPVSGPWLRWSIDYGLHLFQIAIAVVRNGINALSTLAFQYSITVVQMK